MPNASNLKLKVTAGSCKDRSKCTLVSINDPTNPIHILSEHFEGYLTVRVKDFNGISYSSKIIVQDEKYFSDTKDTSSIQFIGKFKGRYSTNDILWGNDFDEPIKSHLPTGTSVGLWALKMIDAALETDLYAPEPWAYSPLYSTMTLLRTSTGPLPSFPVFTRLNEDTSSIVPDNQSLSSSLRREFFAKESNRRTVNIDESVLVEGDFSHPFINFNKIAVHLPVVGLDVDILKYWNGLPFRYVCKTRDGNTVFFCIYFELIEEEKEKKRNRIEKEETKENDDAMSVD
ncbi:UPF0590 protein [Neolecta irregularis DAH-3]|uniref:UPF0590 protein n=1 Tax=Neolecta irregularis (strain DAH-3) TaxID=1198029 RepID=A0A1U7LVD7_NEOID|nr:UPF0590 protein [Neolecta irregularis DAH-3]|eukprot:OLL26512.1 UPF0590 protein [Neolecta irregularis DAH-3]